jgi:hypothetical protein
MMTMMMPMAVAEVVAVVLITPRMGVLRVIITPRAGM